MVSIFFAIIALFVLPDVYIWTEYLENDVSLTWSIAYWLPTALALVLMIIAVSGMYSIRRMRIYFGMLTCIALPKLLFVLFSLLGLGVQMIVPDATHLFNLLGIIIAVICCLTFTYGFVFGWRMLKVRESVVESDRIPASFDGYRILQISDLHLGTFESKKRVIRAIVAKVHKLHPDLVVFTGDLVNTDAKEILPYMDILSYLSAKDGVYSILGNHDYCQYSKDKTPVALSRNLKDVEQREEEMGWFLLLNQNDAIERGKDAI